MDAPHHMAAIMEVDLTACHPNTLVDRFNAVPVLKTSAAFFSFLRANLVLPHSEMSSNVSTPVLGPVATQTTKVGSSTTAAAKAVQGGSAVYLDDIPPLTLGVLTTRVDKVDALQLVADSVAQQRQTVSRSLVFYPLNVAGLGLALGLTYHFSPRRDLGMMLTVMSGVVMTYLLSIRYFSAQYIQMAEEIKWDWLKAGNKNADDEDTVIGARFGKEIIGALVLRLEAPTPLSERSGASTAIVSRNKSHSRSGNGSNYSNGNLKGGHGVIRAWTTKLRYRRRGIGGDLLQEAVRVTREHCGKDADIYFDQQHANSRMVVSDIFNGPFHKTERLATHVLEKVMADQNTSRRTR